MNSLNESSNWLILQPDVLGSEQEGWQVNNAYSINQVIRLQNYESDEEVVTAMKAAGLLPEDISLDNVDIDGDEEIIYINDASSWQPLWHLVRTNRPMVLVH
jgi:hypothetical protein